MHQQTCFNPKKLYNYLTQSDVVTKYKAAAEICNSEFFIFRDGHWGHQASSTLLSTRSKKRWHIHQSTTEAIAAVVDACKDGAKVVDLCRLGDETITKWALQRWQWRCWFSNWGAAW